MISPRGFSPLAAALVGAVALSGAADTAASQRLALVVTHVVDGNGEPVEGVEVRLIRCRGARRFTMVPSFEAANPTGVPIEPDRDNCDVRAVTTDEEGAARFPNVRVGENRLEVARDSTFTYLIRAAKPGYTRARLLLTPHVARNDVELVVHRTVGERMFELIDEAEAAAGGGDVATAEGAMIQAVAMMTAEIAVRGLETPDVLLESMRYLAYLQFGMGNDMAALESLDELLGLAPDDVYALRTAGVVAVRNRDWEQAGARFATYLRLHPESGDAHLMMGNLLLETGELEAALAHLERSAELDREQPLTYRSLGAAYEQVGRSQEAISSFERYLDLAGDPVDAEQVRTTIALLRRSLRNEPERLGNRVDGGNPSSDGLRTKRSGSPRPAAP